MIMKPLSRNAILLLASCALAGCQTTKRLPITREMLIGTYTYVSEDPENRATDHNLDHLVLQSDGEYDLLKEEQPNLYQKRRVLGG